MGWGIEVEGRNKREREAGNGPRGGGTHFSVSFNAINSRTPRDICSGLVPSWTLIEAVSKYAPLGSRGLGSLLLLDGRRGRISRSEMLFCVQR